MSALLRRAARRGARALHRWVASSGGGAPLRAELALLRRAQPPERVAPPPVGRVLVLAPHMDDEALGCGGTLAQLSARGTHVSVVYLTDGSRGYAGAPAPGTPPAEAERVLVARRKEEARRAAKHLGIAELCFLDLPDGALATCEGAVDALAHRLRDLRPELVFVPFFTDLHPDHRASSPLFCRAARAARLPRGLPCWGYEVWWPLPANALVDIGATQALKQAALAEFTSQNTDLDYPRAIEGLGRYRSLLCSAAQSRGHAEAFYRADLALYEALLHAAEGEP